MDGSPTPGPGSSDEIDALRRRLSFYEGFDAIIQDNVRRSGELLREAEERHAAAMGAARDAERRLAEERRRQQEALSSVAASLRDLTASLAALTGRVESALDPAAPLSAAEPDVSVGPGPATLVVEGLADVAEAQAVRSAIAALAGIRAAEPREFAAGLLRIDLDAARPIASSEFVVAAMPLRLAVQDGGGSVIVLRRNGGGA